MTIMKENFINSVEKMIHTPWRLPAEKKLVNILYKNYNNIKNNNEQGYDFLDNIFNMNKKLIMNKCSESFNNSINNILSEKPTTPEIDIAPPPSNDDDDVEGHETEEDLKNDKKDMKMVESVLNSAVNEFSLNKKNINYLINNMSVNKTQQMSRYFKIETLTENLFVIVPKSKDLTAKKIVKYALESKQISNVKNVKSVKELTPYEFKQCVPDTEQKYDKLKDENPRDASSNSKENKFSTFSHTAKNNFEDELWKSLGKKNTIKIAEAKTKQTVTKSLDCPKCNFEKPSKIAGGYGECPSCGHHWKLIVETDTGDMAVMDSIVDISKFSSKGKKENEQEILHDNDDVLQEKFIKFVKQNCDVKKYLNEKGELNLNSFLSSKTFGFIHHLQEQFISSLKEETGNGFKINNVLTEGENIKIFYTENNKRRVKFSTKKEFHRFLSKNDANWENFNSTKTLNESQIYFHDTEKYWDSLGMYKQNSLIKEFIKNK